MKKEQFRVNIMLHLPPLVAATIITDSCSTREGALLFAPGMV